MGYRAAGTKVDRNELYPSAALRALVLTPPPQSHPAGYTSFLTLLIHDYRIRPRIA